TFLATLENSPANVMSNDIGNGSIGAAPTKLTRSIANRAEVNQALSEASAAQDTAIQQETAVAKSLKPIEIEKIPAIAVEVLGAVTPFSVAPILIAPLRPALSSVAPVVPPILPIPPMGASATPNISAGEAGFAIYVPPIVERAAIKSTPAPVTATATLPALATPPAERDFASYVTPPVIPAAPVPSIATDAMAIQSPAVVVPAAPVVQIAPLQAAEVVPIAAEPIAPLSLRPATKTLETYRPPTVDASATAPALAPTLAPTLASPVASAGSPAVSSAVRPPGTAATPRAGEAPATAAQARAPTSAFGATNAPAVGLGAPALLNAPLPLPPPPLPSPPPPMSPSTTAPRLDLDQLRRQAREATKEESGSRALLPFPMVAKETPKKDMEKIFDKALKRPDCKEVYADLGLLAVVPLLRDAAKDGGCKW
ncbi:MAG: hypothetical protein H7232_10540, partial [Aeromicrobium sp.]|nr:hypothetical protein [Burkholderiales bacterium]